MPMPSTAEMEQLVAKRKYRAEKIADKADASQGSSKARDEDVFPKKLKDESEGALTAHFVIFFDITCICFAVYN